MFNLEQIKSARVPFDKKQGVYFLFDGDEVVYVGQSVDPVARVHHHASNGKTFDSFSIVYVSEGSMDEVEAYYIWLFYPKYNGSLPTAKRYKSWKEIHELYNGIGTGTFHRIAKKHRVDTKFSRYDFEVIKPVLDRYYEHIQASGRCRWPELKNIFTEEVQNE